MQSEWSAYFEYICSLYSGEIAEKLEKSMCNKLQEDADFETAEKKMAYYYEQAAIVAIKHFMNLAREMGIL